MNMMQDTIEKQEHLHNQDTAGTEMKSLVSVLLYNYHKDALADCLDSVLCQNHIKNYEILICDDATNDGAWDIALKYAKKFKGQISLNRNKKPLGEKLNQHKGLLMCKGEFSVELTGSTPFESLYALDVINKLKADQFYRHFYINRLKTHSIYQPLHNPIIKPSQEDRAELPLVSVCIYNYNYGRYLKQCIESVLSQTYPNIEICFSDNASEDDSWNIAVNYAKQYPKKFSLSKNRINFGPNMNLWNCVVNMKGKYVLKLCSDDAIKPDFIEKCINAFQDHPEAGFAMVHRDIIDEFGKVSSEPSFYDQSCLIPGHEQAAVYMMSSINPSISQIVYNVRLTQDKRMSGNLNDRWFGDRIMDFHICCDSPIIYIKEPLLLNRIHPASESSGMDGNLLQCVGEYVLLHQLSDIAGNYPGMDKSRSRLPEALHKLSTLCIRYALKMLLKDDQPGAKRYYYFALAIDPEIVTDKNFAQLAKYWECSEEERKTLLDELGVIAANLITRTVSYPVPEKSLPLKTT